jgi:uncharacterized protein
VSYNLDTSFLVSILFVDSHTDHAFEWLEHARQQIYVSDWVAAELFALVQRRVRKGLLEAEIAAVALIEFDVFAVDLWPRPPLSARAGALAALLARDATLKLSAADSLHLAIGADGEHCLVTFDLRLAAAARARGYPVEVP